MSDPVDLDALCRCRNTHRHGEARTYKTHRCRCLACSSARWRRDQRRAHARHRGTAVPQYGPAADVRAHIAMLAETGATLGAIATAASVHRDTISRLVNDADRMVQAPIRLRILAVRVSDVDGLGTSTGAHRRLQALAAIGWSSAQIAADAGMHPRVVLGYTTGDGHIRTPARRLIVATYCRLWDKQPPTDTAGRRAAVTYQRNKARRLGWAPPMAWDDIDHDDEPSLGEPDPGPRTVGRIHPDDIAWMLRTEHTSWAAAERLGISREYLLKLAGRHGIELPAHIRVNDADRTQFNRERGAA